MVAAELWAGADLKGGVMGRVSQAACALWQPCWYSRFTCTSTLPEGCVHAALGEEKAPTSSPATLPKPLLLVGLTLTVSC